MTPEEVRERGWDCVDVVLVTGDAYVDHPSFAMAVIGRVLEAAGFRVAILSQPDWRSCRPWRRFGEPRLFFGVSAGNVDSLINHYTAAKKIRTGDDYTPGGRPGRRPDRATLVYCQRAREAYPGTAVIAGGVEASMRRLTHYDYWSDTVRGSILLDSKADLLVYGMGESAVVEIAKRLASGESIRRLRDIRGTVYAAGASEKPDVPDAVHLPSFEEVRSSKESFLAATRWLHRETNPFNAKPAIQRHGDRAVIQNPPALPLTSLEMDRIYGLPYVRRPHPAYQSAIPAFEMIRDSITLHRGCFGGCNFCSLTLHQGSVIQSRSEESVLREIEKIVSQPGFKGILSDLGGPTANMYAMGCKDSGLQSLCRRQSCLHPVLCRRLRTGHEPLLRLLRKARQLSGVRKVLVASGIRMDLALCCPEYIRELAAHHTGGHLKVAPEHVSSGVLELMRKPEAEVFLRFRECFEAASRQAGKEQYLVPYFISGHPGSDLESMAELALFLKSHGYRPLQVMDFIPAPMEISTAMYYTGKDPMTGRPVYVARGESERRLQRALLQYFKPENRNRVIAALKKAGKPDLTEVLLRRGEGRSKSRGRRISASTDPFP